MVSSRRGANYVALCKNHQFPHVWKVFWSKTAVSACLKCVDVNIISFSMSGMCCCQKRLFQHSGKMLLSKLLVSACLECVVVKNVSLSMVGICCGLNCQLQHSMFDFHKRQKYQTIRRRI
jgi:hypothetical protein